MRPAGGALRIIATLEARHEQVAQAMLRGIAGAIGPYAASPEALQREVLEHCDAHLRTFLSALRAGTPLRDTDLAFVRQATARRANQGLPLDAILHAFRIGHRVVWDAILAEAARLPAGEQAAVALARPSMEYIDLVSSAVADTYLTEQQAATADRARTHRDLLELILAGRPLPQADVVDGAGEHVVVVAGLAPGATTPGAALRRAAETIARAAAHGDGGDADPLVVVRHDEVVGLLPARDGSGLAACDAVAAAQLELRGDGLTLLAGVSIVCGALGDAPRGYAEAREALTRTTPATPLFALPRMSLPDYLVVTADATAGRIVPAEIRALAESGSPASAALVQTVLAFVECDANVRRTADALHAHPNTVHYRLRRVAERTGRDVHRLDDLIELHTSLRLLGATRARGA